MVDKKAELKFSNKDLLWLAGVGASATALYLLLKEKVPDGMKFCEKENKYIPIEEWTEERCGVQPPPVGELKISDITTDKATYIRGETVTATIKIQNTYSESKSVYVSASTINESENVWYDFVGWNQVSIPANSTGSVNMTIELSELYAELGYWGIIAKIHTSSTRDVLLDEMWKEKVFHVAEEAPPIGELKVYDITTDKLAYKKGETVTATIKIENTYSINKSVHVGASTIGEAGNIWNDFIGWKTISIPANSNSNVTMTLPLSEYAELGYWGINAKIWVDSSMSVTLDEMWKAQIFEVEEDIQPPPTTGILSLTSNPTSGAIYLNGSYKGVTPINLTVQSNTSYTIECAKSGYITSAVGLSVGAGLTKNYSFTLTADVCTPNWSYGIWSPDPSNYYVDELFTQTRTVTDLAGCESSYTDSRQIYGTKPRPAEEIDATVMRNNTFKLINPQGTHDFLDSGSLTTYIGNTLYIKFRIKNKGNLRRTFYCDSWIVAPSGWTTYCRDFYFPPNTPKAVTLDPDQISDEITFIEKIGDSAPSGTHKVYVSVAEDEPVNELGTRLDKEYLTIYIS